MFGQIKQVALCALLVLPIAGWCTSSDDLQIEASKEELNQPTAKIPSISQDKMTGGMSISRGPMGKPDADVGNFDRERFEFETSLPYSTPMPKRVVGYRDFWFPMYKGIRLSYCTENMKVCGLELASKYCELLGYDKAAKMMIDHNVGLTHYPATNYHCKGWKCDGFKYITCQQSLAKKPTPTYYYRYREFAYPRFDNYRVDWCYKQNKQCGKRAADSFCRHLGYRRSTGYEKVQHVLATKTIGSQALCFGESCKGFSRITCYR